MNVWEYARRNFDRLARQPYTQMQIAWAIALGIDVNDADAMVADLDDDADEDADLAWCRRQRHGVTWDA